MTKSYKLNKRKTMKDEKVQEKVQASLIKFDLVLKEINATVRAEYINELRDRVNKDSLCLKTLDGIREVLENNVVKESYFSFPSFEEAPSEKSEE